jgi:hypothetical protein
MSKSRTKEIAALFGFTSVDESTTSTPQNEPEDFDQIEQNIEFLYGKGKNDRMYKISMKNLEEKKKKFMNS